MACALFVLTILIILLRQTIAHVAGEKRRWELTVKHWDTDFIELDKTEDPLSVYLPSAGGCR